MIGKLSGIVDSIEGNTLILDVGGVGYVVQASARTLSRAGQTGDPLSLSIETHVREDAISLFGFMDAGEKSWFKLLTSVQGVGAKAALAILSVCPPDKIGFAIAAQDKAALTQADGVGPKLASRILSELKDKAGDIDLSPQKAHAPNVTQIAPNAPQDAPGQDFSGDAVSALVNLGYSRSDAYSAVLAAQQKNEGNDNSDIQTLIRLALKELSA